MPFGVWAKKRVLDRGAHRRHLTNTIKQSVPASNYFDHLLLYPCCSAGQCYSVCFNSFRSDLHCFLYCFISLRDFLSNNGGHIRYYVRFRKLCLICDVIVDRSFLQYDIYCKFKPLSTELGSRAIR